MVEVKKFSASWCGPCRALAPVINEVKTQFSNVKFSDHDVDEDFEVANQFGIRSVPTVVFLKDGVEIDRVMGLSSKNTYVKIINEAVN
jgi:thioredoxin 1